MRPGGHVLGLRSHLGNRYFARLDIKDFFGCITKNRVTRSLKVYFPYDDAQMHAKSSTVRQQSKLHICHSIPYGFVQSPILATLTLAQSKLGSHISTELHGGVTTTVYMDDIIISSHESRILEEHLEVLRSAASYSRFPISKEKSTPVADSVSAFNIVLTERNLALTEPRFTEFHQVFHETSCEAKRQGIHAYISSINRSQADRLLTPL